jgi:hypothetical protein
MNELEHLRSTSDDVWELGVLRSARGDQPPSGARERVAAALGVSATLVASSGAAATVAGAQSVSAAGAGVTGVASAGSAAASAGTAAAAGVGVLASTGIAGWAGAGVVAGLVTSVTGHLISRPSAPQTFREPVPIVASARPVAERAAAAPLPAVAPNAAPDAVTEPEPEPRPIATAVARPERARDAAAREQKRLGSAPARLSAAPALDSPAPAPAPAPTSRLPAPAQVSLLAEEVRALDEVNQALERNDAGRALAALARYRERFANGALRTEARVLRVKALLRSGNVAGAEREAEAILRADPGGRYAERVRALLQEHR